MKSEKFDAGYYARFYRARATRVADPAYFDRLAAFTAAYLDLLECPVRSVLDAGCGTGALHAGLRRAWPQVRIDAFDVSHYACRRYGWQQASIASYQPDQTYDLVICHDVLQYLDDGAASAALRRLTSWTDTALLFGVLTAEDWRDNCDQQRTDADAHLRAAAWYRRRLRREFRNAGGGLYLRKDAAVVLYALDAL